MTVYLGTIGFGGLIVGAIFLVIGFAGRATEKKTQEGCTEHVEAEVVKMQQAVDPTDPNAPQNLSSLSFYPVFKYTLDGRYYTTSVSPVAFKRNDYRKGDKVELIVNPSDPDKLIIVGSKALKSIHWLVVGGTALVIGVVSLILRFVVG